MQPDFTERTTFKLEQTFYPFILVFNFKSKHLYFDEFALKITGYYWNIDCEKCRHSIAAYLRNTAVYVTSR